MYMGLTKKCNRSKLFSSFQKQKESQKMKKGFTFIEFMIIVAIIGILALIAISNYMSLRERAQLEQSAGYAGFSEQKQDEIKNNCQLAFVNHPANYGWRYSYDPVTDTCFLYQYANDNFATIDCRKIPGTLQEVLMAGRDKCPLAKREPVAEAEEFGPLDE